MISVVVADDQAVVRDGLILLLSASDEITVVGAAADGPEAVSLIAQTQPQVALLDLRMPGLSGAEVTAEVATRAPCTRALILTTYADDEAVLPALRAGAAGYLTKDATGETLLNAIRDVAAGRTVLDAAVQRRLVEMVTDLPRRHPQSRRRTQLRPRQISSRDLPAARSTSCGSSPRACRTGRLLVAWS